MSMFTSVIVFKHIDTIDIKIGRITSKCLRGLVGKKKIAQMIMLYYRSRFDKNGAR